MFVCVGASVGDGNQGGSSAKYPGKYSKGKAALLSDNKHCTVKIFPTCIVAIFMACDASKRKEFPCGFCVYKFPMSRLELFSFQLLLNSPIVCSPLNAVNGIGKCSC